MIFMAGILFSCVNDLDTIKKVTYDPKAPDEITEDLSVTYTDSGYVKVRIYAAIAETYHSPEHLSKLKDSVKIDFFSEDGELVTTLTSHYGEVNFKTGKMFVRDSVHLYNFSDQRELITSSLYYDQNDSTIYTNDNVIIRSKKGIGYGTSIRTKQDFSYYKLTDPRGDYEFNQ